MGPGDGTEHARAIKYTTLCYGNEGYYLTNFQLLAR